MLGNRAHGTCEEGKAEVLSEDGKGSIRLDIFADGIHIYADALPFIVIAHGGIAHALCAGAGNLVATGPAVADIACLAVRADAAPCVFQHFVEIHMKTSLIRVKMHVIP